MQRIYNSTVFASLPTNDRVIVSNRRFDEFAGATAGTADDDADDADDDEDVDVDDDCCGTDNRPTVDDERVVRVVDKVALALTSCAIAAAAMRSAARRSAIR